MRPVEQDPNAVPIPAFPALPGSRPPPAILYGPAMANGSGGLLPVPAAPPPHPPQGYQIQPRSLSGQNIYSHNNNARPPMIPQQGSGMEMQHNGFNQPTGYPAQRSAPHHQVLASHPRPNGLPARPSGPIPPGPMSVPSPVPRPMQSLPSPASAPPRPQYYPGPPQQAMQPQPHNSYPAGYNPYAQRPAPPPNMASGYMQQTYNQGMPYPQQPQMQPPRPANSVDYAQAALLMNMHNQQQPGNMVYPQQGYPVQPPHPGVNGYPNGYGQGYPRPG